MRITCGPKMMDEMAGGQRRLHNDTLRKMDASTNIITVSKSRRIRWTGHVAGMVNKKCIQNSGLKPEGKRPLGRPRSKQEDNITMYLREIEWEAVDWIHLAQERDHWWDFVNTVMNLRVP
jgi:hypothetical protein